MKHFVLIAAFFALCIAPALAQQRPGQRQRQRPGGQQPAGNNRPLPQDPIAKVIDADSNGTITPAEMRKASERIKSLDSNADGAVDFDELRAAMRAGMARGQNGAPAMGRGGGPGGARGGGGRGGGGRGGPGSPGSSSLENAGLKVGMAVPGITIHNDTGGDFPMASLKDKYTVIVFGCLT